MTLNKRKFYLNKPLALKHSGKLNLEAGAAHIGGLRLPLKTGIWPQVTINRVIYKGKIDTI